MEQINLYTPDLRPKRLILPAPWAVGGVVALLVVMAGAVAYLHWQAAGVEGRLQTAQRELETAQNRLKSKRMKFQSQRETVERLEGEVESARSELRALSEVGDLLARRLRAAGGKARVLEALGRAIDGQSGMWLTGVVLEGAGSLRVRLTGRTDRPEAVPAYLERVAGEPVFREGFFRDVTVGEPSEEGEEGAGGTLRFEAAADFELARAEEGE